VSLIDSCPLCGGELRDVSLGSDQWTICDRCHACARLGYNVWTPPHLCEAITPDAFGAESWDAYYAQVAIDLSGCKEIKL